MLWKKAGLVCIVLAALAVVAYAQTTKGRSANLQASSGYLGVGVVGVQDLTPDTVKELGLKDMDGVLVSEVKDGQAGARAGIHKYDVILEFNGQKVDSSEQFLNSILGKAPGTKVTLTVSRYGVRQNMVATLATRPADLPIGAIPMNVPGPGPFLPDDLQMMIAAQNAVDSPKLGFDGFELGPQLSAFFGIQEGVLVKMVYDRSPAQRAGMKAGDIVIKVSGMPVANQREISGIVRVTNKKLVVFTVIRGKKEVTLNLEVASNRLEQPERGDVN